MRRREWALWAAAPFVLALLAGAGCERARPYGKAAARGPTSYLPARCSRARSCSIVATLTSRPPFLST